MSVKPADENWIVEHLDYVREAAAGTKPVVLDLGCGPGIDSRYLSSVGSVVSADLDASALRRCREHSPSSGLIRLDISQPLPFKDAAFQFLLSSLSLHYFSWSTTELVVGEIRRCLSPGGRCIVRVNSTLDTNYGADSQDQIEYNYYRVGTKMKRFFDEAAIRKLFCDWRIDSLVEREIDRYEKKKTVWEVFLRVA